MWQSSITSRKRRKYARFLMSADDSLPRCDPRDRVKPDVHSDELQVRLDFALTGPAATARLNAAAAARAVSVGSVSRSTGPPYSRRRVPNCSSSRTHGGHDLHQFSEGASAAFHALGSARRARGPFARKEAPGRRRRGARCGQSASVCRPLPWLLLLDVSNHPRRRSGS